jgi:hypothetical protein
MPSLKRVHADLKAQLQELAAIKEDVEGMKVGGGPSATTRHTTTPAAVAVAAPAAAAAPSAPAG